MQTYLKLLTVGLVRSHSFYLPPSYFGTILPITATATIMYGLLPALVGGAIYIVSTVAFFALIIHLFSAFLVDLYMAASLSAIMLVTLFIIWVSTSFRINYEANFKRIRLHYISRSAIIFLMMWLSNKLFDLDITTNTKFLEIRLKNYQDYQGGIRDEQGKREFAREIYTDFVRLTGLMGNDIILYGFSAGSFEKLLVEAGMEKSQIKVFKTIIPSQHSLVYGKFERNFYIHIIDLRSIGTSRGLVKRNNVSPLRPIK